MAEKLKKKPSFFSLKRWNSQKGHNEPASPRTPNTTQGNFQFVKSLTPPVVSRASSSVLTEPKPRKLSAGGIKELVQCSLCLEVLHNPKMLPCQHTFCMACLYVYMGDLVTFQCPVCRHTVQVTGSNFVKNLPSNLYINSLLQLVGIEDPDTMKEDRTEVLTNNTDTINGNVPQSVELAASGVKCTHCHSLCDNSDITSCEHCKLNFCRVCWEQHLDDMRTQIGSILKQLDTANSRLDYKMEHYKDRCDRVTEQIELAAQEKIDNIFETKAKLLNEVAEYKKTSDMTALALKTSLEEARDVATQAIIAKKTVGQNKEVKTFINLHHNTLQLLSDVSKWDSDLFVFDKENFSIEVDAATPLEAESDDPVPSESKENNPLESENSLIMHYRSRNFIPHYVWRKTARPCGVAINPWTNHLYVCGMDSHNVLVVERTQAKIVTRLSCDEMLCPVHIAFLKSLGEIYVTDKWKHCIHVFSKEGEYLRSIGQKGSRSGMFRSPEGIAIDNAAKLIYVVDTGNDRVQVLQPDGKCIDQMGVVTKMQTITTGSAWNNEEIICTELNAPTSVAVTKDRVVILDSGNRRVKVYNKQDRSKITEFGAMGQRKGQFRQPEVLTVDPMGYILVGDSGNCRVQVFKPSGQLVRVFGGYGTEPGKFGWISGIHVTKEMDIIISDTKNHSVNFF